MEPMTDARTQALRAAHRAVRRRVYATNGDLGERLQTLGGIAYYDPSDDWFLLSLGQPARGVVLEMAEEWSWRVDPETWQIVGLEIPSVAGFERASTPAAGWLRRLVQFAAEQPRTWAPVPIGEIRALAPDLRALMPT
jgi:hypothetical protein